MLAASEYILSLKEDITFALVMYACLLNAITHESLHSSPSLLSEYFWYDKLWGPSQRVVTLFLLSIVSCFLKAYQVVDQE